MACWEPWGGVQGRDGEGRGRRHRWRRPRPGRPRGILAPLGETKGLPWLGVRAPEESRGLPLCSTDASAMFDLPTYKSVQENTFRCTFE